MPPPRGPRQTPAANLTGSTSRISSMPDLRFLNYTKPPVTARRILASKAADSEGVQIFTALKDAEAWFSGTIPLLRERLMLCENTRDALKEANLLLAKIEDVLDENVTSGDDRVAILGTEQFACATVQDEVSGVRDTASHDLPLKPKAKGYKYDIRNHVDGAGREDKNSLMDVRDGAATKHTREHLDSDYQLRAMELAVEEWLREVRVLRAKWIAGGRNVDRLTGLR